MFWYRKCFNLVDFNLLSISARRAQDRMIQLNFIGITWNLIVVYDIQCIPLNLTRKCVFRTESEEGTVKECFSIENFKMMKIQKEKLCSLLAKINFWAITFDEFF